MWALPEGYLGSMKEKHTMAESKEPCARCARLSMGQVLLDWVPVIPVVIKVVLLFVQ